jgi:hypothetical protein
MSQIEEIMRKRQKEAKDNYEAQWDNGKGAHHPDFDPDATGDDCVKASRETEELYNAIIKNDIRLVYQKVHEGADVNFVYGRAYQCPGGCVEQSWKRSSRRDRTCRPPPCQAPTLSNARLCWTVKFANNFLCESTA